MSESNHYGLCRQTRWSEIDSEPYCQAAKTGEIWCLFQVPVRNRAAAWSLRITILTSSTLPPPNWPPVTIHPNRSQYHDVNLPMHSCCHPSVTNNLILVSTHSTLPALSSALSVALDGWPQVFILIYLRTLYSLHLHLSNSLPVIYTHFLFCF